MSERAPWETYWDELRAMSPEQLRRAREQNPGAAVAADIVLDHWKKLEAASATISCQHVWKMEGHRRRVCTKCWCVDVILWEPEVPRAPSQDKGTDR